VPLDLVDDGRGLAFARQQHEEPAGIHAAQPQHSHCHRVEPVEGEQKPSICAVLRERLPDLARIDHS
jgi:hypothetical protein